MPEIPTTSCGDVPQVTVGSISDAGITISRSYLESASEARDFQYSTARFHVSPRGDIGRPLRYSNVISSGAIIPARAPPSMAMLQILIRASMESERMASPANSITEPFPPAVPMTPMMCKIISLLVTPSPSFPSIVIRIFFDGFCNNVCVASTCSTSLVPIPNASAPNAPCVAVCESPHTTVVPGSVNPCSGPMMCTIPCLLSSIPKYVTPNSFTFSSSCNTCTRESISLMNVSALSNPLRSLVGTL
mmetsp:Transcript_501/g.2029  ORF Transcript_501/g.2029 Transcript_501/m.2029 type:complete len:247 (+) Transcript_501:824-1564(+)